MEKRSNLETLKNCCLFISFIMFVFWDIVFYKVHEVYEENYVEIKIEELPQAENVLLATGYRTGSTFFAELFNQNDEVFYVSTVFAKVNLTPLS